MLSQQYSWKASTWKTARFTETTCLNYRPVAYETWSEIKALKRDIKRSRFVRARRCRSHSTCGDIRSYRDLSQPREGEQGRQSAQVGCHRSRAGRTEGKLNNAKNWTRNKILKARDVRGGENNLAVHAVDQTPIIVNLGGISMYLGHTFSVLPLFVRIRPKNLFLLL